MAIDKKIHDIFSEQPYDGFRILDRLISAKPSLNLDTLMAVDSAKRIYEEYRGSVMRDFEDGKPKDRTAERILSIPYPMADVRKNEPNPEKIKLGYYLLQVSPPKLFLRALLYVMTLENYGKPITRYEKRRLDRIFVPFERELRNAPKKPLPQTFPGLSRAIEDACSNLLASIKNLNEEVKKMPIVEVEVQYGFGYILNHVWKNEIAGILSVLRYSR